MSQARQVIRIKLWTRESTIFTVTALTAVGGYFYYHDFNVLAPPPPAALFNQSSFTPFRLAARQRVSDSSSILRLQPVGPATQRAKQTSGVLEELWKQGVWSIEIKQPQLMIARRYTPLPTFSNTQGDEEGDVEDIALLVRREPYGEMSRYLDYIPLDRAIEIRGGYSEYTVPDTVREVVFLAGGTGIAPALQVAKCLQMRGHKAKLTVLWANRRRDDCVGAIDAEAASGPTGIWSWLGWSQQSPALKQLRLMPKSLIVQKLNALSSMRSEGDPDRSSYGNLELKARYFVDEEKSLIRQADIAKAISPRTEKDDASSGQRLIMVSGPDGFVEYVAGGKRLVNGIETQGSLGGLLSKVDTRGWQIWKL